MASDSNSDNDPTHQNPNPNPNPASIDVIEDQLASSELAQSTQVDALSEQEVFNDAPNGSLSSDEDNHPESEIVEESRGGNLVSESSVEVVEIVEEVRQSSSSSGDVVLRRTNSELEMDQASSPSSSGYAGERGSTSSASAIGVDEICEVGNDDSFNEASGSPEPWVTGKRHGDEVVFLVKGPVYLVCISCTEEPYGSLRGQLDLIYGQMLLILTKSVNRCFEKNPKFDMTPLLGGTDGVFSSLIHSFSWNPAIFLHAYTCLPLAYATRQAAGAVLQDVAGSGVVSLVGAQKASLHPDDMLLLSNFVMSSESFRQVDTYLILLTTSSDAFYHLKDCRIRIEMVLLKSNVLSEVQRSMLDGGMHVEDLPADPSPRSGTSSPHLGQPRFSTDSPEGFREAFVGIGGPAGLWHFIYRSIYLDQYVSSEFSSPINSSRQQKRLYRAYQKLYASMHDKSIGPHKTQFRRDENYVLLCWVTQDFELYAAFDPLADKAVAIKTCNQVCQWVKDVENEIFLLGASPFSW
ncbi:hypothetical protein TEA_020972 [Camellia sinensis var. sinensis]|uniref:Vacuolar fusion protein MON1 homolog n=1 Tax=Camellia sinensis var. sinensis TaxID=542762 RepID=A0A4S4ECQ1_CAMSN|nr:hypothetical protein TEA_020972 [Camellia sinensis var. sinensis]